MSVKEQHRPFIIRRKKIVRRKHGGEWKIALADFMTALMALFLVLWLLSTTTEAELESVAEYFRTPLLVAMAGGDRATASISAIPGGGPDASYAEGERARIDVRQFNRPADVQRNFMDLERRIRFKVLEDPTLREMRGQLRIYQVPEGLLIQVLDSERRPMFQRGSDVVEPDMHHLLRTLAPILDAQPSMISISGHTDSLRYAGESLGYSNWELSADRANASRRELMVGGLRTAKLLRIVGMADQVPIMGTSPGDPVNRRIELMVMDDSIMAQTGLHQMGPAIEVPFSEG